MAGFPQTYQIVQQDAVTPVTVGNDEEVITFRTELALMSSFAQGATTEIVEALEARLAAVKSEDAKDDGPAAEDIEDMLGILRDAMNPATAAAIARLDTDFPKARGEIDMASVEKESGKFHEDAGRQVAASGKPAAGKLSQIFKQALLKNAVAAKQAAEKGAGPSSASAAESTSQAKPVQQQPPSTDTSPVGELGAASEETGIDPVEAALREAMGVAEKALAAEGGEAMGTEDELDGEEGLSVEELETQEALEVDEAMEVEEAIEAGGMAEAESLAEMAEMAEELDGQDPVQVALAEAIGEAAEIDGQAGDAVGAALAEAVDAVGQGDPVESILAEQEAGDKAGETPSDALEQIMAEQATLANGEIPPEQLADVLLAGQTNLPPIAEKIDEGIEKEWAEAVQVTDASQLEPEAGSVKEKLKYAGDHMERDKANAGQSTPVMSQDDAGSPDVAAEEVAQALEATRSEIDAIASAFQEATSNLDSIEDDVTRVSLETDQSVLAEADLVDLANLSELTQQADMSSDEAMCDAAPSPAEATSSAFNLPSLNMREELQTIRQTIQTGLEGLTRLLDRVDQVHVEAEGRLAQARTFQQAAQRAQEVSEKLVQAQTDAVEAKAAYESAQRRFNEAKSAWEDARRAADDAAL